MDQAESLTNICDFVVFCGLHDQLAALDRHAQLTRCFSAVAELLVFTTAAAALTMRELAVVTNFY